MIEPKAAKLKLGSTRMTWMPMSFWLLAQQQSVDLVTKSSWRRLTSAICRAIAMPAF
jgi:hypothetical protein